MGTFITVAVYLFGVLFFIYLVVCEFLDTIGRLEIVEKRWPKVYNAMSNRPMRLILLVFLVALVAKDLVERAKEKREIAPMIVNIPAPPAPIVQMFPTTPPNSKRVVVENNGTNTGQINGNTLIDATAHPGNATGVLVTKGTVNANDLTNLSMCRGEIWECFLKEAQIYSQQRDMAKFEKNIETLQGVVDLRGRVSLMRQKPEDKQQCDQEFSKAIALVRANVADESNTVQTLLPLVPICLTPQFYPK